MSSTIHRKYKYFHSTVQTGEDRRQKFHFCRLPFAVNVMLNLSNNIFARSYVHHQALTHAGWLQNYFGTIQTTNTNTFENTNVIRHNLRIFTRISSA